MRFLRISVTSALVLALAVLAGCGGGNSASESSTDAVLEPTSPRLAATGSIALNTNTRVMAASDLEGASMDDRTLTVRKPQSAIHAVGTVLVVSDFGGRLIQVTRVGESANDVRYEYAQVGLEQAFRTMDVQIRGTLTPDELGSSFVTNDPDFEIKWADQAQKGSFEKADATAPPLQVTYKNLSAAAGFTINGTTNFQLNPNMSITRQDGGPTRLAATVEPQFDTTVLMVLNGKLSAKQQVLKHEFKDVILVVSGVPIVVRPVLTVSSSISGTAKATTTSKYTATGRFGFVQTGANLPERIGQLNASGSMDVVGEESAVEATLPKVELAFLVYGLGGPAFDAGLNVSLSGTKIPRKTPPLECTRLNAEISLKANAGLKVDAKPLTMFLDISPLTMLEVLNRKLFALNEGNGIYSPVGCEKEEAPVPTPTPTPVPTPTPTPTPTPSPNPQPTPNPVPQPGCKSASGALTAFGTHPDVRNAAGAYSATVLFTNLCMPTSQAEFCSPAYLAANRSTIQALIDRALETVPVDLDVEYEGALVGQTCTFSGGSGTFTETSRLKWVNARTGASGQGDYHQSFTIRFN